jgi:hypothetical protein
MNQDPKLVPLLGQPLKVINVGLDLFHQTLKLQEAKVLQVDWQPPADGDQRLTKILDKLLD